MAMNDLMTKINRIFNGVVGCTLEFQPAGALSKDQWSEQDLEVLKSDRAHALPCYVEGADASSFGFPVNLHGAFAGLAVVRGIENARPKKLLLLAELLTIVLEHGMRQEERRERLRLIEERLHLLDENSNVIPLRPARFGRILQVIDTETIPTAQPSPLTSTPILIETKLGFPLHRIAVEIHHLSKRWAFVSIDDLPPEIFQNRESLQQLGSVTLFIRDLSQLTGAQQIKLAEYLATKPTGDSPHVIAGCNGSVKELVESGRVLGALANLFCVSKLQWTDKTPEQVTAELINASLHHILEQTRETHTHGEHFIPFHIQYFDPDQPRIH